MQVITIKQLCYDIHRNVVFAFVRSSSVLCRHFQTSRCIQSFDNCSDEVKRMALMLCFVFFCFHPPSFLFWSDHRFYNSQMSLFNLRYVFTISFSFFFLSSFMSFCYIMVHEILLTSIIFYNILKIDVMF